MSTFHNIDNVTFTSPVRVGQRQILPSAVKARNLGSIIFGSVISEAQTSMANGDRIVLTTTLNQDKGFELIGVPYVAVYVGSVAPANLLPGGSAVTDSQWQVTSPRMAFEMWEQGGFARSQDVARLFLRNISAGTQTVIFRIRWKYLSPQENI